MTRTRHACLGWRNVNARHRGALAAERKERARIRGEKAFAGDTDPLAA